MIGGSKSVDFAYVLPFENFKHLPSRPQAGRPLGFSLPQEAMRVFPFQLLGTDCVKMGRDGRPKSVCLRTNKVLFGFSRY